MKNLYFAVFTALLLVCLPTWTRAQGPGFNYYEVVAQKDRYFDSLRSITPDTVKIPGWRSYQRWKDFWMNRVHNDATTTGSFAFHSSKLLAAYSNPAMQANTNPEFSWNLACPSLLDTHNKGIIVSLWIDPDNIDIIFAGSNTAGMFATQDGGSTWTNVTDNIGLPAIGVKDIAVDPTNKNIKYIAVTVDHHDYLSLNQPAYIYKTTDNCLTWFPVLSFPPTDNVKANRIIMDPSNSNILYALIKGRVYRTMDAGTNWEVVFNLLGYVPDFNDNKHLLDIEFKPGDPNTIYISSNGVGPSQYDSILTAELWMTNNAGDTVVDWYRITDGIDAFTDRIGIEINPQNSEELYIIYAVGIGNQRARTFLKRAVAPNYQINTLFTKDWENRYSNDLSGTGYWCLELEISPEDPDIAFIGGHNLQTLHMSTGSLELCDACKVTAYPDTNFHVDQRIFKTVQFDGTTYLYCGNDGGVSRYNYNTKTMESLNGLGLDNLQYYGIGHSPTKSDFYIGGTQDNGVLGNGNNSWGIATVGDAYEVIIDPLNNSVVYCTSNGSVDGTKSTNRSVTYGKYFISINNGIPVNNRRLGLNDRPFRISPFDHNTLYVGYDEIFKTINGGSNWTKISDFRNLPNGKRATDNLVAIGLTEADQSTIYAAFAGPTWSSSEDNSRLFVTYDGGVNWIDLSNSVRNIIHYAGITDIHVSPEDKNKVWISFMGYWDNANGAVNRVLYSENGGQSWTDISFNLPNLPVNCLNGINLNLRHRLLLGNDLGIFMYDEIAHSWENIGNGLPNSLIYDIEVNQPGRKILVATYGRGIWSTDIPCEAELVNIEVEGTKVFSSDYIVDGNLKLKSGCNLTIKGELSFNKSSKVNIERGAKLILDGGKLTSSCGETWRGIDVWGNSYIAQIPTTNQGHIQIINGGTIENAECGIRTWKPDALPDGSESLDPDKDYFGGIVWVNGAVFKNNKTAVEFMPYEFRNYSYLTQCSFQTTAALPNGALPDYFVKLDGVSAVSMTGNDFNNTYTGYTNINERGGGIYAFDSDVLVDRVCKGQVMPCKDYKNSTFTGLYRGIYALGARNQRTVRIQGSDFSNTVRGIYLSSLDFADINLNNFQVWNEVVGLNPQGYSVYIDASTGFTIEENNFTNPETSRKGIGLIINESGADNNQVYNNYFANLNFATIAQGYNRSGGSTTTGLCYKCNDFVNNDNDIRIARRNSNVLTQQDGIKYYQGANIPGDHLAPAGNTFTTVTNSKDISNSCNWIVYYRHHIGPASLLPSPADLTTNYQVFATTYTKSVSCPSHLGTGTEKEEVKAALESATTEAEATQVALISLVDGGSTPELQTEVITSIPDDGMELRDQLLTESPYLSDTVLKTSIEKENVLNNAMIRDVLVANPQSAKSAQMVEMLDERVNPMTDEMKNEILSGQIITSEKEDLEAVLSFMKQEAWYNFGALCRLYAIDTLHTWSSDTIGVLFANETSLESQYKLAFWHLFKGNTSSATQVMSSIPGTFTLDAPELAQHERYSLLLNTLFLLSNDPEVVLEAGTDVANTLTQLNTMSEDKPAAMSRNLLIAAGLMSYDEPIKLDDVLKTMPVYNPSVKGNESSKLRVYPNPANDFITIAWNTPDNSNLLLTLTDANGRTVHQQQLNGQNNETILNVSGFVNGTYQLRLSANKKNVATETVVIHK